MMVKGFLFHIIVLVVILVSKTSLLFAAQSYRIAPPPDWVKTIPIEKPTHTTTEETINETYYLLLDRQTKVDQDGVSYFNHIVKKIMKREDIEEASNIEIEFNPLHEEVILHQLEIHRGNQTFSQVFPHNIKILQREKKLEEQLYTGIKSLYIFLEDVRVGDVIEYSYVIKNTDTGSSHTFFYNIFFSGSSPIYQIRERLLWPRERNLAIKNHSTNIKPEERILGDYKEYIWSAKNIPILQTEENTPFWYNPYEYVQISEKKNWHDIALQKLSFYTSSQDISEELKKYINNIRESKKNPADQFITVMRFIQDEIQYRGIAGPELSRPADPSLVFRRRFGDCKDKTFLAITILKELGIEAYPALVNTNEREAIRTFLPSLHIFDHAIVVARIHGKQYWIDPTRTFQRGSLENFVQPDYGYALIVDSKTTDLTKMPSLHLSTPLQEIYETFDLRQGHEKSGRFTVKTIYRSYIADERRETLLSNPKTRLQSSYLEYYQTLYPSVRLKTDISITDDIEENEITLVEEYEIDNPWVYEEADKNWSFSFYAQELEPHFNTKGVTPRSMPLSIPHPTHIYKKCIILLPENNWNFIPTVAKINDSSFTYKREEEYKKNVFSVSFNYKTLKDHVNPSEILSYVENLNKANQPFGGAIYDDIPQPEAINSQEENKKDYINWAVIFAVSLSIVFFIFVSFKLYSYQLKNISVPLPDSKYSGIKGWLIIPLISLVVTVFIQSRSLNEFSNLIYSLNSWIAFSDPSSINFYPLIAPFILCEIIITCAFLIFSIFLIILFLKKKRSLPLFYIYFLWGVFVWEVFDFFINILLFSEPLSIKDIRYMGMRGLSTLLWSFYFLLSERVKATFVKD